MKVSKIGEITPCCDWVKQTLNDEMYEIDSYNSKGDVTIPWLRVRQLSGWYVILRLHYCPVCGEKTEVEGLKSSTATLNDGDICQYCGGKLEEGLINGLVVCKNCGLAGKQEKNINED
jgi:hypothetical protein